MRWRFSGCWRLQSLDIWCAKGHAVTWLLINRAVPSGIRLGYQHQPGVVCQTLYLPLLGVIPEDEQWGATLLQRQWMQARQQAKPGPAAESSALFRGGWPGWNACQRNGP